MPVAVYRGSAVTPLVAKTLVFNVGGHTKFTVADGAIATRLPRPIRRVERRRYPTEARALTYHLLRSIRIQLILSPSWYDHSSAWTEFVVVEFPIFHVQKNQSPSASMLASAKSRRHSLVASDQPLASCQYPQSEPYRAEPPTPST